MDVNIWAYLDVDWYLFHSSERLHVVVCVRAPASHISSKFKPGSPAQFGIHSSSSAATAEVPGPPLTDCGGRGNGGEATGARGAFRRKARTSETLERRQFSLCGDEEDAAEAKKEAASDDEQAIRGVESRNALGGDAPANLPGRGYATGGEKRMSPSAAFFFFFFEWIG
jgi:hypothetical protein